ncbi:hypothetical protein PILCRDRAFT_826894 [Piloderma croceum F 1598]|uniref:Uncharacterized protein n=1 Tax=Piloderma croceum (strain F 1598) TaxID=765440 RepID=A0A0C3BEW2_PILCF|nr:hypothetical protein PILCRDRAFT_826894 [Piloderma croceum F 1598]
MADHDEKIDTLHKYLIKLESSANDVVFLFSDENCCRRTCGPDNEKEIEAASDLFRGVFEAHRKLDKNTSFFTVAHAADGACNLSKDSHCDTCVRLYSELNVTWWSGPLLHMACTSQPWFLFQFSNRRTCT